MIIDVVDIYFLKDTGKTWRVDDDNVFTEDEMSTQSNFLSLLSMLGTNGQRALI